MKRTNPFSKKYGVETLFGNKQMIWQAGSGPGLEFDTMAINDRSLYSDMHCVCTY